MLVLSTPAGFQERVFRPAGWDLSRPVPDGWQPTQDALRRAAEEAGAHTDRASARTRGLSVLRFALAPASDAGQISEVPRSTPFSANTPAAVSINCSRRRSAWRWRLVRTMFIECSVSI